MWNPRTGKMGEVTVLRVPRFRSDRHGAVVYRRRGHRDHRNCAGEITDTCQRKWSQFSGRNVRMCWTDSISVGDGRCCGTWWVVWCGDCGAIGGDRYSRWLRWLVAHHYHRTRDPVKANHLIWSQKSILILPFSPQFFLSLKDFFYCSIFITISKKITDNENRSNYSCIGFSLLVLGLER